MSKTYKYNYKHECLIDSKYAKVKYYLIYRALAEVMLK